jgi:hypothetical protein
MHIDESINHFTRPRGCDLGDVISGTGGSDANSQSLPLSICWAASFVNTTHTICMHSQGRQFIPRRYQVFLPCSRLLLYTRFLHLSTCVSSATPYVSYLYVSFLSGGYGEMESSFYQEFGVSYRFSNLHIEASSPWFVQLHQTFDCES